MNAVQKKYKKAGLLLSFCLLSTLAFAQENNAVEMADTLRRDGKIYTVVVGLVVVLTGFLFYLIRLDRKVDKLERNG